MFDELIRQLHKFNFATRVALLSVTDYSSQPTGQDVTDVVHSVDSHLRQLFSYPSYKSHHNCTVVYYCCGVRNKWKTGLYSLLFCTIQCNTDKQQRVQSAITRVIYIQSASTGCRFDGTCGSMKTSAVSDDNITAIAVKGSLNFTLLITVVMLLPTIWKTYKLKHSLKGH